MSSISYPATELSSATSAATRGAILIYGIATYIFFLAVFTYTIGFVGGFIVPKHIENGVPTGTASAIAIDVVLLALFAIQHSVMARPAFKRWWTRIVPPVVERSTFVLFATALLALIVWQWRPLPGVVWQVTNPIGVAALHGLYFLGWGIVLYATFLIDHFELFGVRQAVSHAFGWTATPAQFTERSLYRHVRHPLMLGFLVAFWAAPVMSPGRLLFAGVITAWVLVAIRIEESTLVAIHGEQYEGYRRRVPALLPRLRSRA
ncbi:MAG: isoprenylcysteine carboxylmethyltransferase family protein [Deltaproteobacteria bacterium]|nr:MAG: isoprenylcysteine carboxylmethyltransferase family protein [Deltaproteobacteria bacterium]